jgi:NAD(P)-dependent dehydrogenase (short-subunit alcohol dehydrogenase family)
MADAGTERDVRRDTQRLAGKTAFVAGGASGLGAEICQLLVEEAAHVICADVNEERAAKVVSELQRIDLHATTCRLDVGVAEEAEKAVQQIIESHGQIDILINCAAVDVTSPAEELSVADWTRVINTNLNGPYFLARAVIPHMRRQGGGHIVNIASTASKRVWANASAYHASKWGLLGLSHALHVEARPHGIKVTAVVSGGMRTPFLLDRFPDIDTRLLQDPRNVAETVMFVLTRPRETVIPEIMVLPMTETSWP